MNYEKIYNDLIQKRLVNKIDRTQCYCEYHHIRPRSIYPELENQQSNIIALTAREHYIAHKLLTKIYIKKYGEESFQYKAMIYALWNMMNTRKQVKKINSRYYEKIKIEFSKIHSQQMTGSNNPMFGEKLIDHMSIDAYKTMKRKQRQNNKLRQTWEKIRCDKIRYNKWKNRLSKSAIGKKYSDDRKKLCGKNNIGKHWWNNGIDEVFQFNCPNGFKKGRLPMTDEHKNKISKTCSISVKNSIKRIKEEDPEKYKEWHEKSRLKQIGKKLTKEHKEKIGQFGKGKHWWNNGLINVFSIECPNGFKPGKIHYKKY